MPTQTSVRRLCIIAVWAILVISLSSAARAVTIGTITSNSSTIGMYNKYELTFNLSGLPADTNPFSPNPLPDTHTKLDGSTWSEAPGVDVWSQITTPSGKSIKVYGFWNVDFEYLGQIGSSKDDRYVPTSSPHWNVRYAPSELGAYKVRVYARDASGTAASAEYTFNCVSADNKGFVNVAGDGKRLAYSNGEPYTAFMGKSIGATNFAASGINTVRTWISNSQYNGVYEEGAPQRWTLAGASYDAGTWHSGKRSVRRSVTGSGDFATEQRVGIRNSAYYKASAWIKTSSDFNGQAAVRVTVHYTDGSSETFTGSSVGGGAGWTWSSANFDSISSGKSADYLDFKVAVVSGSTGTVWADDVELIECNSDYSTKVNCNYLWTPSFEEWNPTQLRMCALQRVEQLFSDYEKAGITQQLVLFDYKLTDAATGFYTKFYGNTWYDTNSDAAAQQDASLRYLVARFGHFRSMLGYELMNEMDSNWTSTLGAWVKDKADYIHSIDPYGHMVTNSYWNFPANIRFEQLDTMNINQEHYYMMDEAKSTLLPQWGNMSSGVSIDTSSANAHSGSKSLKLSGGSQKGILFIKPSHSYTVRFYGKGSVNCGVSESDETGKGVASRTVSLSGASTYTQKSQAFTSTGTTASVNITLSGSGSMDDIELIDNTDGKSLLFNGGFEAVRLGDDEFEWSIYNTLRSQQINEAGPNGSSKPWVAGEFGLMGPNFDWSGWINYSSANSRHDDQGIHIHNTLWGIFIANSAIQTPCYWWLDYVNHYNLWPVWKGVTEFAKKIPFNTIGEPVSTDPVFGTVRATSTNSTIRVLGQKSGNSAYIWVQNVQNTWAKVVRGGVNPSAASADISIPEFANGTYTIDWYDTYTGAKLKSETKSVTSGTLTLSVSALSKDTAAIIKNGGTSASSDPKVILQISADKVSAVPSDVVTYTIIYANTGSGVAANVAVTFPIPSNTTYVDGSASNGGTYDSATKTVRWNVPSVPAGLSGKYTAQVRIN